MRCCGRVLLATVLLSVTRSRSHSHGHSSHQASRVELSRYSRAGGSDATSGVMKTGMSIYESQAKSLGGTVVTAECPAGRQDCTEQLQAALTSPGAQVVVIPANRAVWPTRPLVMDVGASNRRVVFERGVTVEALKGAFQNGTDSLLSCYGLQNVSFEGAGAHLRMHKADYANHHKYSHSESRMGLQLMGCRNVSVAGLNISATGGDGIYVAGWGHHVYLKNGSRVFVSTFQNSSEITVSDVHCHDNYRQGMSIISVVGMNISDSTFSGTNGTAPQFGIDMEPNRVEDSLQQIQITNCSFEGNVGGGIMMGLHKLSDFGTPPAHDTTIMIRDCTIDGTGIVAQKNGHRRSVGPGPVSQLGLLVAAGSYAPDNAAQHRPGARGSITISNVRVKNTVLEGILIEDKAVEGNLDLVFRNVSIVNGSHYDPLIHNQASKFTSPIQLTRAKGIDNGGMVRFEACTVVDSRNRSFFSTGSSSHQTRGNLSDVRGTFNVTNPFGCFTSIGPAGSDVQITATSCRKSGREVRAVGEQEV